MAHTTHDGDAAHRALHADRYPRQLSPTSSEAIEESTHIEDGEDHDLFKAQMDLLLAERKIGDLEVENQRLHSDIGTVKAFARTLELESASNGATLSDAEALRDEIKTLTAAMQEKEVEVRSVKQAAAAEAQKVRHTRPQMQVLQCDNTRLTDELSALKLAFHENKTLADDAAHNRTLVNELQAKNAILQNKVDQDGLTTNQWFVKLFESERAVKKSADDAVFLTARLKNMQHEEEELKQEIALLTADRDRYVQLKSS
jgi:hypothetical protein